MGVIYIPEGEMGQHWGTWSVRLRNGSDWVICNLNYWSYSEYRMLNIL